MSTLQPISDTELATLRGRTVLITGGASGIGRALAVLAHSAGANVGILDVDKEAGKLLAAELADWQSVLAAFETVSETFGSIDSVYANAGINAFDTLFDEEFDDEGRLKAPTLRNLDVNLGGILFTTKAAVHFFTKQGGDRQYQLVLTGSAASLLDTPPLYIYCAAKAGVLGLMRGLRSRLLDKGISVNMIAPWMTGSPLIFSPSYSVTPMLPDWIRDLWGTLPANSPEGVARALIIPAVRPELNGRTLWVAGNNAIELESGLYNTRSQWLGKELSEAVDEGQKRMNIAQVV
ncbi:hypothetical protein CLAIMM_09877 [Cladophialophora immunda]|nr:hypothetical protein CLAIMM_09877 [Cladophialophora immunda]